MRRTISIITCVILFTFPDASRAEARPDLLLHSVVSAAGGHFLYVIGRRTDLSRAEAATAAFATWAAIGIAKEISDPMFDWSDVAANSFGSALGIGAAIALEF